MRIRFSADLLTSRFKELPGWEQGKLYLVVTEDDVELALGIKWPQAHGKEKQSACVLLTGAGIGRLTIDEVGEVSMRAVELPEGWDKTVLVMDPCPVGEPLGPGAIGMLNARDHYFMLLDGTDGSHKYAYLHLGELRIRDSNEALAFRRTLTRIEHPALGA